MDSVAENAPSIIEAAAQSPLGIIALLILTAGALAYLFFGKAGDRVKVAVFTMFFVAMAGFGLLVLGSPSEAEPARSDGGPERTDAEAYGGGVSDDPDGADPAPPDDAPDDEAEPARAAPARPQARRAEVTLTYAGDFYGCNLQVQIDIGDRTFRPQTNPFQARDLLPGPQPYEIGGVITCPAYDAMCEARGSGTLDVVPNAVYGLSWQNTEYGVCDVFLHRG